jgi:hypothetical protein
MNRVNFYHLLGLPISPPENDPQKIREVIRKKQTEWSRYRNHPTKGMRVRQYIGLITEIERVMLDPDLREKEATEARRLLLEKARKKLTAADRHVGLLLSKGWITAEEVTWLAAKHRINKRTVFRRVQANNRATFAKIDRELESIAKRRRIKKSDIAALAKQFEVDDATIEKRIAADLEKKFAEIDRFLNVRTTKEYLTDEELAGLARLFHVPESEILRRVSSPIRKKSELGADKVPPLDKTIETVIEENLNIVGKSSLYDFLGLWLSSSLESLQKRAGEKEAEIRRISQKNVFVSASGILAGHCISIFKTAESRNAYDISRAHSRLKELHPDIDVAGMTGTVRPEYMQTLVRRAVSFGVDPDEARATIRAYCEKKRWSVEEDRVEDRQTDDRKRRPLKIALAAVLVVGLAAGFFWLKSQWAENRYHKLLAQANQEQNLERRRALLAKYYDSHKNGKHAPEITRRIETLDEQIVEHDYRETEKQAAALLEAHQFEKAAAAYDDYLRRHPRSPFRDSIKELKEKLPDLIEAYRFQSLSAIRPAAYLERIDAYRRYFDEFPEGANREAVLALFLDMETPFYNHVREAAERCDMEEQWDPCVRLCDEFIEVYGNTQEAEELKKLKTDLLNRIREARDFETLKKRADETGNDIEAARRLYAAYLAKHPATSTRKKIERELAGLEIKQKQGMLASTGGRFVEKRPRVVTDTKTGLMWALQDSLEDLDRCLSYQEAIEYVASLTTGGFSDWRLPSPKELQGIYDTAPAFPFQGGEWLWTSASYRRYSDGWFRVVEVVAPQAGRQPAHIPRHERECGCVRAVRP